MAQKNKITPKKEAYILKNRLKMTSKEIGEAIGCTGSGVSKWLKSRGLSVSRKVITPKWEKYILENRLKMSSKQMAEVIGCSPSPVSNWMRKNGLSVSKELSNKFKGDALKGRTIMTMEQDAILMAKYMTVPVKPLAQEIGVSHCCLSNRMKQLGLVVPKELRQARKRKSLFKKGHTTFNKGLKQADFLSPEQIEKLKKTQFQKGHIPHNDLGRNGIIRVRKDTKTRAQYKYIRVSRGNWELLQRHNYRKYIGEIPDGHVVRFKNGNTLDCGPENLELITLAENARRNTEQFHSWPEPLKKAIRINNKLTKTLRENGKSKSREQQNA